MHFVPKLQRRLGYTSSIHSHCGKGHLCTAATLRKLFLYTTTTFRQKKLSLSLITRVPAIAWPLVGSILCCLRRKSGFVVISYIFPPTQVKLSQRQNILSITPCYAIKFLKWLLCSSFICWQDVRKIENKYGYVNTFHCPTNIPSCWPGCQLFQVISLQGET